MEDVIAGRNSVGEALKSGRPLNKLFIAKGERQGSLRELAGIAKDKGILVQEVEPQRLAQLAPGQRHQGVVAMASPVEYAEVEDILAAAEAKGEAPLLVVLDELEDPHNLGAVLRSVDAAGAHGVIIPKRRSCPLSTTVAKTSAGAVEYVPVARVSNLAQTLDKLKKAGIWVAGCDMDGTENYFEASLKGPLALVIGGEGRGLGRLVKEHCDFLVRIPMQGHVNSLNASVACSLVLYEAVRQRLQNV
ncbi:23S rRNA (guanosine(2251)-2'-O)-methyltransferase RlmB [Anaeromusa sp.]|uniref:23S rRNA (guanosine(2251)-2'-O)-methyltransferase RlmB n=1 Tax=Anaeromusa sp. TaxID=1872520 RepID=UPI00262FFFE3|nr:23S rRNA (guanosine(2251)-2'-O)-methyltransferase RlmB [Anaeromusa sp.]MDD3156575.1 23S rRNA (guanosine(2251)-2'-O)-methyltransferase RlmB [Anaeromusa sp.]NCB77273.1 23S rRNA (guanosine(2251)-2'-O)-methyltransferase RlmB [Negativicutes bacterium]